MRIFPAPAFGVKSLHDFDEFANQIHLYVRLQTHHIRYMTSTWWKVTSCQVTYDKLYATTLKERDTLS